jgi:hypothetical protein
MICAWEKVTLDPLLAQTERGEQLRIGRLGDKFFLVDDL